MIDRLAVIAAEGVDRAKAGARDAAGRAVFSPVVDDRQVILVRLQRRDGQHQRHARLGTHGKAFAGPAEDQAAGQVGGVIKRDGGFELEHAIAVAGAHFLHARRVAGAGRQTIRWRLDKNDVGVFEKIFRPGG